MCSFPGIDTWHRLKMEAWRVDVVRYVLSQLHLPVRQHYTAEVIIIDTKELVSSSGLG